MEKFIEQYKRCCEFVKRHSPDGRVKLLKGGSYKIKQYYLETNDLDDIRGASALLGYVEKDVVPGLIKEYIKNSFGANEEESAACIIYSGGGNIFCILPQCADESLCMQLENEGRKYLVSANTAYVMIESSLDKLEKDYKTVMHGLEERLADRKKLKLYNAIAAKSEFFGSGSMQFMGGSIDLSGVKKSEGGLCRLCKTREAKYTVDGKAVCASCMHKHMTGRATNRSKYRDLYIKYVGTEPELCRTVNDIDSEDIAVVYGDGNNMGQIIQNITSVPDMMKFSADVKTASEKAVFGAMKANNITRFQIVGLGGDDVFVIVPAAKALKFTLDVIKIYNGLFKNKNAETGQNPFDSTMSAGICIAKSDTPIRVMLGIAEDRLAEAKEQAKRDNAEGCDTGTLSFSVISDPTSDTESFRNKFGATSTLLPYSTEAAEGILEYVKKLKSSAGRTSIRNIYDAYMTADSNEEAWLFLNYLKARTKNDIALPEINGYELKDGLYMRTKGADADEPRRFIWRDIIEIERYVDQKG